jgi:hypothetical protein
MHLIREEQEEQWEILRRLADGSDASGSITRRSPQTSVALADTLSEHVRSASSLKNADVQHALLIVVPTACAV